MARIFLLLVVGALFASASACTPPPQNGETQPSPREAPSPDLADIAENVHTIQLHQSGDERSMPIIRLGSSDQLTLSFDRLQSTGRPLSIYFYQMNAQWERRATPSDYMESFPSDNLLNYQRSQGTEQDYIHYNYTFPNDQIGFRIGGNYLLRVTEQGNESNVLFEKPFYISEERGQVGLAVESQMRAGAQQPARRPVMEYRPRSGQLENPQNYSGCVLRNARLDDMRCTRRTRMAAHPTLRFEIEREDAFLPISPVYQLDLARIQTGSQIDAIDRQARPDRVQLRPDYPQFRRNVLRQPLYGQSVINGAIPFLNDTRIQAEYVTVRFALASGQANRRAQLIGSFTTRPVEMSWSSEREQMEAEALVKQGWHEYRYERDLRPDAVSETREDTGYHRYTGLIYVRDIQRNTDRIIATTTTIR